MPEVCLLHGCFWDFVCMWRCDILLVKVSCAHGLWWHKYCLSSRFTKKNNPRYAINSAHPRTVCYTLVYMYPRVACMCRECP